MVAQICSIFDCNAETIAAAYLHDILEDTNVTEKELRLVFPRRVIEIVKEVTDISELSDGSRAKRKKIDREHLACASPDGQNLKYADLIDNARSIVKYDKNFARVYLSEKIALLEDLTTGNPSMREKALFVVHRAFDKIRSKG